MSYLNSNYLSEDLQAPMALPDALHESLADMQEQDKNQMVSLPGGIIMKRSTAILLIIVAIAAFVWYITRKKNDRRKDD